MEVELRAKVQDRASVVSKLLSTSGVVRHASSFQVDKYLRHEMDVSRKLVVRLRDDGSGGRALLTFKGASRGQGDVAWQDFDIEIERASNLESLLLSNGYQVLCVIKKRRESFRRLNMEINLDSVEGLGEFIEVELQVEDELSVDVALEQIEEVLQQLGITRDEIVKKGYVPLMLEALGNP